MSEQERETPRDAVVNQAVSTLTYLAIVAAISLAIARRDTVTRVWMRVQRWRHRPDPHAGEVAAFRRDIADISRGTSGPDTTRRPGLYERGQA